jgi:hypothetical protein
MKIENLSEKVFDFECEISNEQALEFEDDINKLQTLEDVKLYYLYERGWVNDESLVDLLFDLIIDLK